MSQQPVIRPASTADLDAVLTIQQQAYPPAFHEAQAAFVAKLARPQAALWLAYVDDKPSAYLLGFACNWQQLPQLDSDASVAVNSTTDFWYWHDLAVAPQAQGLGLAKQLLQQAEVHAKRVAAEAYLIAVDGAASFWQRSGFEAVSTPAAVTHKLASYGADACLMRRAL